MEKKLHVTFYPPPVPGFAFACAAVTLPGVRTSVLFSTRAASFSDSLAERER